MNARLENCYDARGCNEATQGTFRAALSYAILGLLPREGNLPR